HINDMLDNNPAIPLTVLTPKEKEQRGAQLSLAFSERGKELHKKLTDIGIIGDWREPNIIRIAPAPLYNSFTDIYHFRTALETLCAEMWPH
ncbi:MAG TPA: kynureninase, partial [Candidatus Kapabacteria bacterium]|nr:kynureninase [Candidatus Kapabacteria bacterium]